MATRINQVSVDAERSHDADLIHRISNHDEAALALLYDRYHTILFGLLMRILNNRSEAEDALQDIFVQVWQQAQDFNVERGMAFTWLVTITRCRAIDRLRSLKSRMMTIEKAKEADALFTDSKIEQNPFLQARQEKVRTALSQVPEKQRNILLMAYFEGCSQQEIADQTKIPMGTVKASMRMGMTKLHEILDANSNNL